jgi:hypothetical protein
MPISTGTGTSSSSSHRNLPAIIGGAVGGVTAIVLAILAILLVRRRRATKGIVDIDDEEYADYSITPMALNLLGNHNDVSTTTESRTLLVSSPAYVTSSLVGPVASSDLTSSSIPGYDGTRGGGGTVGVTTAAPGSKAARRQEEIARQFREREYELENLQHRQDSVHRPPSAANEDTEADPVVANQIEQLKREMRELQLQQRQMMVEINEPSPPQYTI